MISFTARSGIVISIAIGSLFVAVTAFSDAAQYEIPLSEPKILGFTFLKSTFSDIANKLGDAKEYRDSKVVEAPKKTCYRAAGVGDSTELIFESDFNGGWNSITGYKLITADRERNSNCTKANVINSDLRVMDERLKLGMSKQEVLASVGKPRVRNLDNWDESNLPRNIDPDHWIYLTTGSVDFTDKDIQSIKTQYGESANVQKNSKFDVWTRLDLRFSSSKLKSIHLRYGKTY